MQQRKLPKQPEREKVRKNFTCVIAHVKWLKKKKKRCTSFCQPARLTKEWQEQQVHSFAHEVKAVHNDVKDTHVTLLSKKCPHTISVTGKQISVGTVLQLVTGLYNND